MSFRWCFLLTLLLLAILAVPCAMADEPSAEAKEVGPPVDAFPDDWNFALRPYFFLSGLSGSVTVDPITIPLNSSFTDLLKYVQLGAFVNFTAEKGQWGASGDFQYIDLYATASDQSVLSMDLKNVIGEVDIFYRPGRAPSLRFLTGVRVYSVTQTFSTSRNEIPPASTTVVDLIIGAYGAWTLTDRWNFELRGDIGGFGISSEFTYQVMGLFHWDINDSLAIPFGYRVLGYNILDDSLRMDTRMGGVMLGLDIRF